VARRLFETEQLAPPSGGWLSGRPDQCGPVILTCAPAIAGPFRRSHISPSQRHVVISGQVLAFLTILGLEVRLPSAHARPQCHAAPPLLRVPFHRARAAFRASSRRSSGVNASYAPSHPWRPRAKEDRERDRSQDDEEDRGAT
jgi:hypothetical protein